MFKLAPYLIGGLVTLAVMDQVPLPAATANHVNSATTSSERAVTLVNRSRKGDRITPVAPVIRAEGQTARESTPPAEPPSRPTARGPRLPIGCDPAFSPLASSASLNFAGRCLS